MSERNDHTRKASPGSVYSLSSYTGYWALQSHTELKTAWIAKEKEEEGIRQTLLAKKEKDIEGGKKAIEKESNIKSLCCTLEISIILYVNYITIKKGKAAKTSKFVEDLDSPFCY